MFQTSSSAAALSNLSKFEAKYLADRAYDKELQQERRENKRKRRALKRERWTPTSGDPLVDELSSKFKG